MKTIRRSFRARILALTCGLSAAAILVFSLSVGWAVSRQAGRAEQEAAERSARSVGLAWKDRSLLLESSVRHLAEHPGTRGLADVEDGPTLNAYLNDMLATAGADWLAFLSPDGRVVAASSEAPLQPGDLHFLGEGSSPWKGPIIQAESASMSAAAPIFVGADHRRTVAAGSWIGPEFLREVSSETALAALQSGVVLASSRPLSGLQIDQERAWATDEGRRIEAVLHPMPNAEGLQLAAFVSPEEAAAPFAPIIILLAVLAPAALGAAVWSGLAAARHAHAPLARLTDAAREIEAERWPEPLPMDRQDEFGVLQGSFNRMSDALKCQRERLEAMLERDPLMEIWNHRRLREEVERRLSLGGDWAFLIADLDRFDAYNRSQGPGRGDEALRRLSRLAQEVLPDDGALGRYGADQAGLILPGGLAEFAAERLRRDVQAAGELTISVGWARSEEGIDDASSLFLAAEAALAEAKAAGRNAVRRFSGFSLEAGAHEIRDLLRSPSVAAVRALAEAVDAKDEYTRGHSQRVAETARALAAEYGCDEGFQELVHVAGLLHDVGKIGVPDSILKKTERLTDEEFVQIKLHPALGERIVRQIPQLRETLSGIRSHHERWDGRGYPDGLAGEATSLLARILAVADTWDAMTSDRPYRRGLDRAVALQEIQRGSGAQFDPALVVAFLRLFAKDDQLAA